jgi:hypothetical protein
MNKTPKCKRCGSRECATPWRVQPPVSWNPIATYALTCAAEAEIVNRIMPDWGAPAVSTEETANA